jgi:hypothetical protein
MHPRPSSIVCAGQLAMLDDYRTRLEAPRSRAGKDIDALIKVNQALAEVQADYEAAAGKRALLAQRVATEMLKVSIGSAQHRPFWTRSVGRCGNSAATWRRGFRRPLRGWLT